jgi:hypothetical protein
MRVLVFIIVVFSCFTASGQVNISPATARWYLEQADKVVILEKRDSLCTTAVETLRLVNSTKSSLIQNLESSSILLENMLEARTEQYELSEEEIKHLKKQLRKEKFKTIAVAVGSGVLILLILI